MRHPESFFKSVLKRGGRLTRLAGAGLAAAALSACSSFGGKDADILGDTPDEINWAYSQNAELQAEVDRLKAENDKLSKRLAELQAKSAPAAAEVPAPPALSDPAAQTPKPAAQATPLKAETVVASADVDRALAESPAPPVDPAPRLVQPSFVSDQEASFENEAADLIKTQSVLYGVHLASYRKVEDARTGWRKLQRENPDELGLLEPRIEEVTIEGRGKFMRLIGGGFSSREKARQLCERLKSRGVYCFVTDFGGSRLSLAETG